MFDQLLTYGWEGLVLAIWLGLAVGSFLNVVIYRLPVMLNRQFEDQARSFLEELEDSCNPESIETPESPEDPEPFNLMVPRSRCPKCNSLITAWQNIPVVSWIVLRGRCHNCRVRIPVRYPLVELGTALATVYVLALFGFTFLGLAAVVFTWMLIALTFIDFDTQYLPDQLTLPLLWLGLLTNLSGGFTSLGSAVLGAVFGYLTLWSTFWAFKLIRGKEGMGYGDFKLLAAIGAWFGWQVLPATILIASAAGLLYALAIFLAGKWKSGEPIPFGPFLAIGGWVSLVARDTVLAFFVS
jgi:leader peptidase (prepilin peptidase)/N-methyltransferase